MGKKSSDTPPAPDYGAAAREQANSSRDVTNMQTWANRPTQNTPWGQSSWEAGSAVDPATGKKVTTWTQNFKLTPEAQKALDSQMAIQQGRSDLAQSFMGRVNDEYSRPFDWGSMPAAGQNVDMNNYVQKQASQRVSAPKDLRTQLDIQPVQDSVNLSDNGELQGANPWERRRIENALFERMQPLHERQQSALDVKLANQGIMPGSVAYKRAQQDLGDQQSRERFNALDNAGQEMQRLQQMALSNRAQLTGEDLSTANLFNQARNQYFNQDLASGEFENKAKRSMFDMELGAADLNNRAAQQDFAQGQAMYDMAMRGSNYQNQLRQQAIAEEMQRRNMSLNELNALLSGQQVGMPQMPQFNAAGASQPYQGLQAAGLQNQYNWDKYNANTQGNNSMMSGMGSLFGSAIGGMMGGGGGGGLGSMFNFSDRGLKKILGKVGTKNGFNLYRFKYLGSDAEHVGVIAQEVQKVRPDLVKRHANGFLMVNYAEI